MTSKEFEKNIGYIMNITNTFLIYIPYNFERF